MFDTLSDRLGGIFDKLKGRKLGEAHVEAALREIRVALLEADVALPVVRDFITRVKEQAVGAEVIKSVKPHEMVVKIVHDALIETLGGMPEEGAADTPLSFATTPPAPILMVGLQGSGKTTSSAKLARRLSTQDKKKVLLASLDIYRPAAQEQLAVLGRDIGVVTLPIVEGQKPAAIAQRAMDEGRRGGFDVVILDTAGRLHIDNELMAEVAEVSKIVKPVETLLVSDAMIGQDAVTLAREFNEKIGVTGIVLTRIDGDARGGAALSMRAVTGCPIKFMGTGEKTDALEIFHAERIAGRILGMGDVVSLVEKAAQVIDQEEAEKTAARMMDGKFDFEDMLSQFRQIKKMGDMKGLLSMLPGVGKMMKNMDPSKLDEATFSRQEAMILSMTPKERRNPQLIKASRKQRIAAGSGMSVQDVNKLMKQHQQMEGMMKKMKKMNKKGQLPDMSALMGGDMSAGMPGGGLPGGGLPGIGGGQSLPGNLPPGFPGFKK